MDTCGLRPIVRAACASLLCKTHHKSIDNHATLGDFGGAASQKNYHSGVSTGDTAPSDSALRGARTGGVCIVRRSCAKHAYFVWGGRASKCVEKLSHELRV